MYFTYFKKTLLQDGYVDYANNYDTIPKVIYMCHKKIDQIKEYSQNWKKLNPDYEIKLYDDDLCKQFLTEEYPPLHLEIFNSIKDGPIKADFWRVCIINKYGGLYVDADIQPLVPLDTYIDPDDDFVTCISGHFVSGNTEWNFNPHFIMCKKGNAIIESCINKYIELYKSDAPYEYWKWSICKVFDIPGVTEKKSQIYYINGEKYKFILELSNLENCEYNDVIVFNNRYTTYDNHNFI